MGPARDQTLSLTPRRSRASAACTGCRQKRKKCVTQPDENECDHCKDSGLPCVFLGDDERRKPRSRLFTQSLLEHIELLESRLKEVEGESPLQLDPSPSHSLRQAESVQSNLLQDRSALQASTEPDETGPPGLPVPSLPGDQASNLIPGANAMSVDNHPVLDVSSSSRGQVYSTAPTHQSLLFETPQLQYSSATGQLSYTGPAERLQRYGHGFMQSPDTPPGSWHMQRRLSHIISELDQETYDYLMTCFWSSYNGHLMIVDQEAFQRHKIEDGDQVHYSTLLHLCCLAMGFRFADKSRLDIQALIRGNRDSIFHGNARYMVESELKKPHRLSTVQSLLILGDLECAGGSDTTSWMYTGLACRFAFEIGLTLDHSKSSLAQREIETRHALLQACVFYDRMWAAISGHPTIIGRSDLLFAKPSYKPLEVEGLISPAGSRQAGHRDMQSWNALLNLMELATKVPRYANFAAPNRGSSGDTTQLLATATLHEELEIWQKELPLQLRWDSDRNPNPSLICLFSHLFFHHTILRLYCPLIQINALSSSRDPERSGVNRTDSPFQSLSRKICLDNAQILVEVLHVYCTKYWDQCLDVFVPHLTTLALPVLLASDSGDLGLSQTTPVSPHTKKLVAALQKMAPCHQLAANLVDVVDHSSLQT